MRLTLVGLTLLANACGNDGTGPETGVGSDASTRINSGNDQIRLPGSMLLTELEVQAIDGSGEPVARAGLPVTWTSVSGGGTLEDVAELTDASGVARARWRLGPVLGDQTLEVAVGGTPTVTLTARAVELGPILFISDRAGGVQDPFASFRVQHVFAMDANGDDVVQLTEGSAQDTGPVRSPDGSTVLFQRQSGESGPTVTMLLSLSDLTETPFAYQDEGATGFVWSPDGTKLAFERLADYGCALPNSHIWVVDADGSNPSQLTSLVCGPGRTEARHADWSPDGGTIVYNHRDGVPGAVVHTVWTMDADGSNQTQVSINRGRVPLWLPDGRRVAVGGHVGAGNVSLRIMDTETGEQETIWENGVPTAILPQSVSPDGRFAIVMLTGRGLPGLHRVDLDTGEGIGLTSRDDPLFDGDASWWGGTP